MVAVIPSQTRCGSALSREEQPAEGKPQIPMSVTPASCKAARSCAGRDVCLFVSPKLRTQTCTGRPYRSRTSGSRAMATAGDR